MRTSLELIATQDGEQVLLCSPEVGLLTCVAERGHVLVPGQIAATLMNLGRSVSLIVPAGVRGRIISERPERVHAPVGHGQCVYRLAHLEQEDSALQSDAECTADAGAPRLTSPQSGRFYHRSSPDTPPFIEIGTILEEGAPVGLIEVMKTFAHVPYQVSGNLPSRARVVHILAEDGADVTEGDALIEVEPA